MENIFTTQSPLGYNISCTQIRWDTHILTNHPIMRNKEDIVSDTVSNPNIIYQSNEYDNTDIYFGCYGNSNATLKYTKVIVANHSTGNADVVSAWLQNDLTGNINQEVIKYVKPKL